MLRVFVYGTLKPGERYYSQYCQGRVVESCAAIAYGHLYDLPFGYPAMISGDRPIQGYVLTFADATTWHDLDELEDYNPNRPSEENEYDRYQIEVFSLAGESMGCAWAYLMTLERVQKIGGVHLPQGVWTGMSEIVPANAL
jgi:gamma-glutamylcyclotransferase (GGCT)/AIG2-like uncharacterized protein YtfP